MFAHADGSMSRNPIHNLLMHNVFMITEMPYVDNDNENY